MRKSCGVPRLVVVESAGCVVRLRLRPGLDGDGSRGCTRPAGTP